MEPFHCSNARDGAFSPFSQIARQRKTSVAPTAASLVCSISVSFALFITERHAALVPPP